MRDADSLHDGLSNSSIINDMFLKDYNKLIKKGYIEIKSDNEKYDLSFFQFY